MEKLNEEIKKLIHENLNIGDIAKLSLDITRTNGKQNTIRATYKLPTGFHALVDSKYFNKDDTLILKSIECITNETNVTIYADRQSGKTTAILYSLFAYLESNPHHVVLVTTRGAKPMDSFISKVSDICEEFDIALFNRRLSGTSVVFTKGRSSALDDDMEVDLILIDDNDFIGTTNTAKEIIKYFSFDPDVKIIKYESRLTKETINRVDMRRIERPF